jgi:hypothetical protein
MIPILDKDYDINIDFITISLTMNVLKNCQLS